LHKVKRLHVRSLLVFSECRALRLHTKRKRPLCQKRPEIRSARAIQFLESEVHTCANDIQADVDAVIENIAWRWNGRSKSRQVLTCRLISKTQAQVFALDRPMLGNLELGATADHPTEFARIKACIFMRGGKRISKQGAVLDMANGGASGAVNEGFSKGNSNTLTQRK
jgi:hypothetical protein